MNVSKKIIGNIIGNKRFGGKNDWDFDGVPNKIDCQPRNTMRQDRPSSAMLMNNIVANDPVIKRLEGAQRNAEIRRVLKQKGYSDNDIKSYIGLMNSQLSKLLIVEDALTKVKKTYY